MKRCSTLLVLVMAFFSAFLSANPAQADHSLNNDIRRFPWWWHEQRCITQGWNGPTSHNTTPYFYALDFGTPCGTNAYNWPIRAATGGYIAQCTLDTTYGLGYRIKLSTPDGFTDIYAHKATCADVPVGATIAQGAYLGLAGNSGEAYGIHLHYDRWVSEGVSGSYVLPYEGEMWHTWVAGQNRTSNNSAVAYPCCYDPGWDYSGIWSAYMAQGGYSPVGTSARMAAQSPCRYVSSPNTEFVYSCLNGLVQTFRGAGFQGNAQHAIMWRNGTPTGFYLPRGTLYGFTQMWNGQEWVSRFGYPLTNRTWVGSCNCYQQAFERGLVEYYPGSCLSKYIQISVLKQYSYCD